MSVQPKYKVPAHGPDFFAGDVDPIQDKEDYFRTASIYIGCFCVCNIVTLLYKLLLLHFWH